MIVRNEADEYVGIRCDGVLPGGGQCETLSPPASDIIVNHGLNSMGWSCLGGTHFCPEHVDQRK